MGENVNMAAARNHIGRPNFASEIGIDTPERRDALTRISGMIEQQSLEVIRVGFVDTNGIVRVRPIEARHFLQAAANGVPFTTALLAMDSGNFIVQNVFAADGGFGRARWEGQGICWLCQTPRLSKFSHGRNELASF